jgi:hypothetical protein
VPNVNYFQTNFSAGELSPRLYARVDVGKYNNGCQKLENFIVQRFGGIRKRGGTEYINEVKDSSKKVRLIPFIFSVTQAYILEFGDLYIRVYTNGGVVESGGSPIEVTTPWDQDEIWDLQFVQSADVLYLTHPDYAPRTLSRTSATTFVLAEIDFVDGPYLELNETETTLTPASTGSLTPVMTNNTTPSGTVADSAASANAYLLFDGDRSGQYNVATASGWTSYTFASGTKVADAYWMVAPVTGDLLGAPSEWTIEGYDGSAWVVLDTQSGQTGWSPGEKRFYEFNNKSAYEAYRFQWHALNGITTLVIAELRLNEAGDGQTPFNLTASSVTGINDDTGFQTTDVGRHIRLLGSDGVWRWAKIAARTSTTVVTIRLYGHALPDDSPIVNWRLGAWSDETGWPACIGFYNQRLCFARTATQPQTVWMTVTDSLNDFSVSSPLEDDDAIVATISSESLNEVKWLAESTDLFVGTSASIRTIGPTASSAAFSPTNIRQKRETNFGASIVFPVRVGTTALYSGYYRKDIREISYSFELNGYVSQDLSILAEHIPAKGVKQIAYAQNPDSVIWMVHDDGSLAGMTYERDQEVIAFHRHVIGGTGVTVESVASIPGTGNDEVWFVVKRTIGAATERYIERLTLGLDDEDDAASATFLDSHLIYDGVATTTITGLGHLNGESVYVWGLPGAIQPGEDGLKQGPYTVSAGSITIGTEVTYACVGLAYTSTLETLSPEAGAAGGAAQTRIGKSSEVFVRVNRSMNGTIGPADGTQETLEYDKSSDVDGSYGSMTAMFTGDVRVPVAMEWGRQKRLKLVHSAPTPFHCLGLLSELKVSG